MDSILGEEKGEMNRIIKVLVVGLLVLMAFPLVVAADEPPPPEGPSIESLVLLPNGPSIESPVLFSESFEGFAFPPSGWSVIQTNADMTWMQLGLPFLLPNSGAEAAVVIADTDPQDEVLLTRKVYAPYIYVLFSSMTNSLATCGPNDNVCDLEVWLVKGAWDAGAGNDIYLVTVDGSWTANNTWLRGAVSLNLEGLGIYKPVRIGFRYVGLNGAAIALDDVTIIPAILNKNYSFERGGVMPTGWTGQNLTTKDKRDNSQHVGGSWSFKMVGSSANKSLIQTMKYSGYMNDFVYLIGYSMSENAKAGRPYQVVVTVHHLDGSTESHKIKFSSGTHVWEPKSTAFLTKEPYNRIDLEIRYWNQTGKAWFDLVLVTSMP